MNEVFVDMSTYGLFSKAADRHFIRRLNKIFGKRTVKPKPEEEPMPVLRVFSLKTAIYW